MRAEKTNTELRKEQIAQAALDIIGGEGVHALSVAGIAERVGIVPSAVYRHYSGKDEIIEAVIDLLDKRLTGNVAAARREASDALDQLKTMLMRHVDMLKAHSIIPHVVFSDGIYTGHPERRERVGRLMSGYIDSIKNIIREGQKRGEVRDDVDAASAALSFMGIIMPAAVLWDISGRRFDVKNHAKKAWELFERGLSARS